MPVPKRLASALLVELDDKWLSETMIYIRFFTLAKCYLLSFSKLETWALFLGKATISKNNSYLFEKK